MENIWTVKLGNGATLMVRGAEELGLKRGDWCVFRRDYFEDLGEIVRLEKEPELSGDVSTLPQIVRTAGEPEQIEAGENDRKARSAMFTVNEWIAKLNLEMSPVNAHYSLDRKLLTVQFCADGRVDFRELVKELSRALSVRIELRQIGVRDETGIFGGIAVCGQPLCCCRFLKEFSSINVKMAKEQDLLLTPATISGVCGRLKCCLRYEHEGYLELEKGMPRKGEYCETPAGRGRITDRNLLTRKVNVTFESGNVSVFPVDEIKVVPHEKRREGGAPGGEGPRNRDHGGKRRKPGEAGAEK
ncbi:MAG: stage 0 sporulation protein [Lentisphaeria bacterium]|nr:stage 0 sporulation protein [Lentisphaeria bacterium]